MIALAFLVAIQLQGAVGEEALKVGDEVVLMTSAGPGGSRRGKAAVAFGPAAPGDFAGASQGVYLVVWQEGWHGVGGRSRIYALRVGLDPAKAGQTLALDAEPIEVAPCKTGVQENPRIAFSKDTFLVVWQDMRGGRDCDVLGVRISAAGKVLDAEPIAIAAGPRTQTMADVVADDRGFMVVWHAFPGEETAAKVFARHVGADGTVDEPVVVGAGSSPRIAWNGKEYLVVYFGKGMILWQRMGTAGKPLPTKLPRYPVRGGDDTPWQFSVGALPEGKGWLIATHGGAPNYWGRSVGTQRAIGITPEGTMDISVELDTSKGKKALWPYDGSAVAADGRYGVAVWQRYHIGGDGQARMDLINGDILAARVDGAKSLDPDGVPVAAGDAEELDPELAGDGAGRLLCVYEKVVDDRSSIAARPLRVR